MSQQNWPAMLGHAIFYNTIFASLSSLEMSSKNTMYASVENQTELNYAAKSIKRSMLGTFIGLIGISLIMYSEYGITGLLVCVVISLINIIWTYSGYYKTLSDLAKRHDLDVNTFL